VSEKRDLGGLLARCGLVTPWDGVDSAKVADFMALLVSAGFAPSAFNADMLGSPEFVVAAAELAEPSGVRAHVTAIVVEGIVVKIKLCALVVEVDLFTAESLAFSFIDLIVSGHVCVEIIDILLSFGNCSNEVGCFELK
jgi:hypothetical protein